jgi:hypothetical protein
VSTVIESPWAARAADALTLQSAVNAAALTALQEVQDTFEDHAVWAWPDGNGGVHVVIDDLDLGPAFMQATSWLAFTINYLYPEADTYPHYVRSDLAHVDGAPLVVPFHAGQTFLDQPAVMVSRSSPHRSSGLSTASRKALSVLTYIQSQPTNRTVTT